jgi:RsiW-degrading membrane proteinase PrsW (M82 family)
VGGKKMLNLILLLIASFGPGLLWLWYFYRQDRYEPEPLKLVFKIFLAGVVLVVPAGLLEQIWRSQLLTAIRDADWPTFLVMAFLVISLIEEGLKTLFLWWLVRNNQELDEPVDGIIYGITLGLGFASLENLLWAGVFGFGVAALRAVVTTLAHASFTGWVGYYIARYKLKSRNQPLLLLNGFLLAFASHGLYDFLLFLRNPLSTLFAFLLIAGLLVRLYQVLQQFVATSAFRK